MRANGCAMMISRTRITCSMRRRHGSRTAWAARECSRLCKSSYRAQRPFPSQGSRKCFWENRSEPGMRRRQFLLSRRTRTALAWSLLSFITLQLGLSYLMSRPLPELRDPEYGYKFKALRQRLQASAGQPLFLLLGSSRTDVDLIPEVMAAADTGAPQQP